MTIPSIQVATLTAPILVPERWLLAEADTSGATSASCYERLKHLFVVAVVMPERKFRHIQGQIVFAHLVVAAHNAAFEQRPEPLNILRVDVAPDILALTMS